MSLFKRNPVPPPPELPREYSREQLRSTARMIATSGPWGLAPGMDEVFYMIGELQLQVDELKGQAV